MYLPKKDIYDLLKTITKNVSQTQPTVFNSLPYLTFAIVDNYTNVDLDNTILSQDIEVKIDIWAESSVEASQLLSSLEEVMRGDNWRLVYSADVPNIGDIFHTVTRFRKIVG